MRQLTFVLALMGSALLLSPAALAQTQSATLRGVVADSSGAVVPGARVVLTNVDQNRDWKFTTNPAGEYVFVQIPPGNYRLSAEAAGFKTYERPNIVLQVAQMAELNISLEVGAISEKMEVTAEAPLLDSVSSSLGEVVNGLSTQALPLNGRNVLQLVALSPGITTTSASRTANIGTGSIPAINFSANGGRNETSEVLVDGSSQIVMGMNQAAYIPTPDAVQEFKIQTNSLSAEYGRTGGAVINIVHRSGTKDFHGTLYDFLRNDKFDANDFFSNRNGMPKPAFRFNQFGFTSGGPLTPSRSSTFYFVSYEGVREVKPGSSTRTVPTMKMRQGDFSEVGNIYDPATIDASGRRQPFPNNQIPSSRFNPVAAKLLQYYPQPNLPGVANNFFSQAGPADVISSQVGPHNSSNDISVKIDRRISDRQNLFGRFSWNDQDVALTNFFDNLASPDAGTWGFRQRSLTLDDTYMLGGWVLHGNAGYAYAANPRDSESNGFDLTTLGLPASVASAQQIRLFPYVSPAGYAPLGPSSGLIIHNRFHTYNWTGDATRLIGGHTLKLGGNYRLNRASNYRPISPGPTFNFSQAWTRPEFNGNTGGDAIAS
ncbi:MAG: carboxypeptidase-like regulatory domain-containing protein, partial [Acidobacteria bacterium]|nr:carboxypeptidase-like regulatory domain-containing protein [Acidobacteriota bacterium]